MFVYLPALFVILGVMSMIEQLLVYAAKFIITAYTSILSPVLPSIKDKLDITLTQVGIIVAFFSLSNSILQPVWGWLEDHFSYYRPLLCSPLLVGVAIGSIGFVNNYWLLILLLFIAGIGISSFHPASFAYMAELKPNNRGMTVSILLLASSLGFVVGPLAITYFMSINGFQTFYLIMIPGILVTLVLHLHSFKTINKLTKSHIITNRSWNFRNINKSIYVSFIYALAICILSMNIFSFVPFILRESSQSMQITGIALSLFALGSATGPIIGIILAKRIGKNKVMLSSTMLAMAFHAFFLTTHHQYFLLGILFFLGVFLMGSYSIIFEIAQNQAGHYVATISSILGGFLWGCGGVSTIVTARFAEAFGLRHMMAGLMGLFLIILAINIHYLIQRNKLKTF